MHSDVSHLILSSDWATDSDLLKTHFERDPKLKDKVRESLKLPTKKDNAYVRYTNISLYPDFVHPH